MQLSSQVIVPQVPVPSLTRWGLSPMADLVFRALAAFGPSPSAELARELGLPVKRVRSALDELAGVNAATPDGSHHWHARETYDVVGELRERQLALARTRFMLQRSLARLDSAETFIDAEELRNIDSVRALHGIEQVRARIAELVNAEQYEHIAMDPEPIFDTAMIAAGAPLARSLVSRGVRLVTLGVPAEDAAVALSVELIASGVDYRELPKLPIKLMILDRRTLILPLDPEDRAKGAWEISAPSIVERVTSMFLRQWDKARHPASIWNPPADLSPREQAIVSLLAAGHTDVSAAEHMAVSLRTITYTVTNLMERYGARSRFQLGLLIAAESKKDPTPDDSLQKDANR